MVANAKIGRFLSCVLFLTLGLSAWAGNVARIETWNEEFPTIREALARASEIEQKYTPLVFPVRLLESCTEDVEIPELVTLAVPADIRLKGTVSGAGTLGLVCSPDQTTVPLENWIGADGIVFGDFSGMLQPENGCVRVREGMVPTAVSFVVNQGATLELAVPEGELTVENVVKGGSGTVRKSGAGAAHFANVGSFWGVLDIAEGTVSGSFECQITGSGQLILDPSNQRILAKLLCETWQGTVLIRNCHDQELFLYEPYGKFRLTDVSGCCFNKGLASCSFELVDENDKIALGIYSKYDKFFKLDKMTGTGTFWLSQKEENYARYAITDLTEFSGRIVHDAACATLVLGSDEEVLWKPGDVLIMGPVRASSIEVKTEGKNIILAKMGAKLTVSEKLPEGLVRTSVDKMKVVYDEETKTYELGVEYVTVRLPELENYGRISVTQDGKELRIESLEDDAGGFTAKVGSEVSVTYEPFLGYIGGGTLTLTITEGMTTFELPESFKMVPAVAVVQPRDPERYEEQRWFLSLSEAVAVAAEDDYIGICTDVTNETIELKRDIEIEVWPISGYGVQIGATFTGPGKVSLVAPMSEVTFTKDVTIDNLFLEYGFVNAAPDVTVKVTGTTSGFGYLGKVVFAPNAVLDLTQEEEETCLFTVAPTFEGVLQVIGEPDVTLFMSLDGNLTLPSVVGIDPETRTSFAAVAEFGETYQEYDETYYTVVFKAVAADYPDFIGSDAVKRAKYDAWTGKPASAADALEAAYLFNCANTPEAVAAARAAFKVTIAVEADGSVTVLPPEGVTYNGVFSVEGTEKIGDAWEPQAANHRFFRGLLK